MTLRAVAFDLDGTLIDSAPNIAMAANKALHALGYPELSADTIKGFVGNGVRMLAERCLKASGDQTNANRIDQMKSLIEAAFADDPCAGMTLYPGVMDLLNALSRAKIPMAIVTNKPQALTMPVLRGMGLDGYFANVVGGTPDRALKPDPEPLYAGLRPLVPDFENVWFIGDSEVDAATGKAANIATALFSGGYRKQPIKELPHDFAFDHHDQLNRYLLP